MDIYTEVLLVLVAAQVILVFAPVYFSVRIALDLGTFWAWSTLILAFVWQALVSISGFGITLAFLAATLASQTSQFSAGSIWFTQILGLGVNVLFTLSLYGIRQAFLRRGAGGQEHPRL